MILQDDFDTQLRERLKNDEKIFSESFFDLAEAILGKDVHPTIEQSQETTNSVRSVLDYYKLPVGKVPEEVTDFEQRMRYLLRPSGLMRRKVTLTGKWWKDAVGPMIGRTKNGTIVAIIPLGFAGYSYINPKTKKKIVINSITAKELEETAVSFTKPLPYKSMTVRDLIRYVFESIPKFDILYVILACLAAAVIGMLMPYANNIIFNVILPYGNITLMAPLTATLICVIISISLFNIVRNLMIARMGTKIGQVLETAIVARILVMPAAFFKKYPPGDLAYNTYAMRELTDIFVNTVLSTLLTAVFSLVYLLQIGAFSPVLLMPAALVIGITFVVNIWLLIVQIRVTDKLKKKEARLSGVVYTLLSAIQKIKLTGSERRVFRNWGDVYKERAALTYNPPFIVKVAPVISTILITAGWIVIYYCAGTANVDENSVMVFFSAFGMITGAVLMMSTIVAPASSILPMLDLLSPVLKQEPELVEDKKVLTKLDGHITMEHVSFRYGPTFPLVLQDISLEIHPKEYLAIVGTTGSGKSTLFRLLLGFETPEKGAIYYDGIDMADLDLKSLRGFIGPVLQEGKLLLGTLLQNILVSAPWLKLEDAWEAAEVAGIADDIRKLPMGMLTVIGPGGGGFSGGQKQRILIARAVASRPSILLFDEATSALDNITQKQVADSLEKLNATRIVIAHRLSTIRNCDRIIVLDHGIIAEEGTFSELIAKHGIFYELASRQMIGENT